MQQEHTMYCDWLTTIANTRLLFNTIGELETFLGAQSIHNNGIKRSFSSAAKLRAAYRDLRCEAELMTNGRLNLDEVMEDYRCAWGFYRDNLYRRADPEEWALNILKFAIIPEIRGKFQREKPSVYDKCDEILAQGISVPMLILMLLRALPGYDSKDGDATDMPQQYDRVLLFLEQSDVLHSMFSVLPAIAKAKEEKCKTRLMLLYHFYDIIETYCSYSSPENIYETSDSLKAVSINMDIEGYWNECGGRAESTNFWQIENALNDGYYFMTHWHKDADNCISGIRYTLFVGEGAEGNLVFYMQHPMAVMHRIKGQSYVDADHVWYQAPLLDECPTEIPLQRMLFSEKWPAKITLTRCEDEAVVALYDRWLNHSCEVIKRYEELEYEFYPSIYAVTHRHIYICDGDEDVFYKVPVDAYEGFEHIKVRDNVGIMRMGGKSYLAFDEFLLYIPITPKNLRHYGIEKVTSIE